MSSATPEPTADEPIATAKAEWLEPSVNRIEVGQAEASDGPGPDGGLAS